MDFCVRIAHSSEKSLQTIIEHLTEIAEMAEKKALKFKVGNFGYVCGLLHDVGKYSDEFQRKLYGEILRVDHSSAGAKEAYEVFGKFWANYGGIC